jgi:ABC-2 type transport system permease protein
MIFLTSLSKELLELWRTYRFLVLAAVFILFGLTSPLIAKYIPEIFKILPGAEQFAGLIPTPTIKDAIDQYIKNISQFGILLALLLSMGAVVGEKEKGTTGLVLVKPLTRSTFIITKFVALAIVFLTSIIFAGLSGYFYTALLFSPPDLLAWISLNFLIWLVMMVYIAITLLFSTVVKSQPAAIGLSFGTLILMAAIGAIPSLGFLLPNQLINWGASLFNSAISPAWPALGISTMIIVACLFIACLIFERQEL